MKTIAYVLLMSSMVACCAKKEISTTDKLLKNASPCYGKNAHRVGAVCNDGTKSKATGRGACSNHGGVKYWLCK